MIGWVSPKLVVECNTRNSPDLLVEDASKILPRMLSRSLSILRNRASKGVCTYCIALCVVGMKTTRKRPSTFILTTLCECWYRSCEEETWIAARMWHRSHWKASKWPSAFIQWNHRECFAKGETAAAAAATRLETWSWVEVRWLRTHELRSLRLIVDIALAK